MWMSQQGFFPETILGFENFQSLTVCSDLQCKKGDFVLVLSLGLAKAFDDIPRNLYLNKFGNLGFFAKNVMQARASLLTNGKQ